MVHLGDGLTQDQFHQEAESVSNWLFSATATGAQFDFEAWRDEPEDDVRQLRILGLSSQDLSTFQASSEEAGNLSALLLRRWCGRNGSAAAGKSEIPFDVGATATFLEELKLTEHTLPPQIRTLLKGNLGTEIHACSEELFQKLKNSENLSQLSRQQLLAWSKMHSTLLNNCHQLAQ